MTDRRAAAASLATLARQDHVDGTASQVRQVLPGREASEVILDLLGQSAPTDSLDLLVQPGTSDFRAHKALQDRKVSRVTVGQRVKSAVQGRTELAEQLVQLACLGSLVSLVVLARLVILAMSALLVLKARVVALDHLAHVDSKDSLARLVTQV